MEAGQAGQEISRDPDSAGRGTKGVEGRRRRAPLSSQEGNPSQPGERISFDFDQLGSIFDILCFWLFSLVRLIKICQRLQSLQRLPRSSPDESSTASFSRIVLS